MSRWLHWFPFSVFCLTKLKSRCQWSWILSGTSGKESTSEIFQAYTWNWLNIVNQLYSNKIKKKKNLSDCWQNPVPCGWRIKTFLLAVSWGLPVAPPRPLPVPAHGPPHLSQQWCTFEPFSSLEFLWLPLSAVSLIILFECTSQMHSLIFFFIGLYWIHPDKPG